MLERTTACLKSGAAREALRCAQKASRSTRLLHSTFWNHGAGDLEMPPWALSMFPMPSDLPLKDNDTTPYSSSSKGNKQKDSNWGSLADGIFLDFLYPPQALAWLRRSRRQQFERWETRNIRRLPQGYKLVSRRYASGHSQRRGHVQEVAKDDDQQQDKEADESKDWFSQFVNEVRKEENPPDHEYAPFKTLEELDQDEEVIFSESTSEDSRSKAQEGVYSDYSFADSPSDLAETMTDRMQALRNIVMSTREGTNTADLVASRALTKRAWKFYQSLDRATQDEIKLKQELLDWLAVQRNELAAVYSAKIYNSVHASARTFEMYAAALELYLRRREFVSAAKLHMDALTHLENGYLISRTLFRHAVDHNEWQLAIQTAAQHNSSYREANQLSQVRVFWLHVSEIPQLIQKALRLVNFVGGFHALRSADEETREFCLRFFKEAVSQEFVRSDEHKPVTLLKRGAVHLKGFESILQHIFDVDQAPSKFAEETLMALLRFVPPVLYWKYHQLASFVYNHYRKLPGAKPSEAVLLEFLHRLSRYWEATGKSKSGESVVDMSALLEDWKRYHGQLSRDAAALLVTRAARLGEIEEHQKWMEYLRSTCSPYEDYKDILWTQVYLYARRADLDKAQQAFAEVRRIMAEHGEEPDVKCWNVLLHAHYRVDDLDGAFTNFQNMVIQAQLKPDYMSFNPLLVMTGKRGDVEGTEDLLKQYDRFAANEPRHASLMLPLMIAHINNNENLRAAEEVMRTTISMKQTGEVFGALTTIFNCLMGSYALHRDIKNTMRVYRWMKQENVPLDGGSFTPLLQILCFFRQPISATQILNDVMPEHNIQPTAFHYSILMAGLSRMGLFARALQLHLDMMKKNIRPSLSSNVQFLKAKAGQERLDSAKSKTPYQEGDVPLEETLQELKSFTAEDGGAEVAYGQGRPMTDKLELDDPKAAYYDFMIAMHGTRKCFEAVQELFKQYKEKSDEDRPGEPLPIRILSAMMSAHWHAGEYDKVEEYWQLAKERADIISAPKHVPQLGAPSGELQADIDPLELKPLAGSGKTFATGDKALTSNSSKQGTESKQTLMPDRQLLQQSPAPGKKHILNRPLQWYLKALTSQSRVSDSIVTVARLLAQGYVVNRRAFNLFIQSLLETSPPLALLAFVLTERFLIPEFPGWTESPKWAPKPQDRKEFLEHIRARYLKRNEMMPEYQTLVRLGAAILEIRRFESQRYNLPPELHRYVGTMKEIRSRAPKTMHAVQSMPMVRDKIQSRWLRRETA